jgi:hypothetical protein
MPESTFNHQHNTDEVLSVGRKVSTLQILGVWLSIHSEINFNSNRDNRKKYHFFTIKSSARFVAT